MNHFQVLCNTGKLQEIPAQFPPETQEITISNQNIRVIPQNGELNFKSASLWLFKSLKGLS
jgi:hypothetical protein